MLPIFKPHLPSDRPRQAGLQRGLVLFLEARIPKARIRSPFFGPLLFYVLQPCLLPRGAPFSHEARPRFIAVLIFAYRVGQVEQPLRVLALPLQRRRRQRPPSWLRWQHHRATSRRGVQTSRARVLRGAR